jgi:hypothetical protein
VTDPSEDGQNQFQDGTFAVSRYGFCTFKIFDSKKKLVGECRMTEETKVQRRKQGGRMKYLFTVIDDSGSPNYGVVDSWDAAVKALRDWHGDGSFPAHVYQIVPLVPRDYSETGATKLD